jgi:hypothetical protein
MNHQFLQILDKHYKTIFFGRINVSKEGGVLCSQNLKIDLIGEHRILHARTAHKLETLQARPASSYMVENFCAYFLARFRDFLQLGRRRTTDATGIRVVASRGALKGSNQFFVKIEFVSFVSDRLSFCH